jgi:hypothetical protein
MRSSLLRYTRRHFLLYNSLPLAASGLTSNNKNLVLFLQDLLPHRLSNGVVADIIAKDYPGLIFLLFLPFLYRYFVFFKFQLRNHILTSPVRVLLKIFLGFMSRRHIVEFEVEYQSLWNTEMRLQLIFLM